MNYELNVKNLALLGVLDEFHQLYLDVTSVCDAEWEKLKNPFHLDKMVKKKIRALINSFLTDTTYVFTQDYHRLHPTAAAIYRTQSFYEIKPVKEHPNYPFTFGMKMVSFKTFLEALQEIVTIIICQRKSSDILTMGDYVVERINKNIKTLVNSKTVSFSVSFSAQESQPADQLIVFKSLSLISCNTKKHDVVPVRIFVKSVTGGEEIPLPVHFCKTCGRVFIGCETLKAYEKEYGKMLIKTISEKYFNDGNIVEFTFNDESELHQYGYNVVAGKLSEEERRALLLVLLKEQKMTQFQIIRDIENAIRIFNGNPQFVNAISKWRSDLLFISKECPV